MSQRKYDSTVARIAGNVASGLSRNPYYENNTQDLAEDAVQIAKLIVAETIRTEPKEDTK